MTTLTLKVPEELEKTLTDLAAARGVSRSRLIRELLVRSLQSVRGAEGVSCLDLAGDLAGSLAGPADLSTSPRHLRGFGK